MRVLPEKKKIGISLNFVIKMLMFLDSKLFNLKLEILFNIFCYLVLTKFKNH